MDYNALSWIALIVSIGFVTACAAHWRISELKNSLGHDLKYVEKKIEELGDWKIKKENEGANLYWLSTAALEREPIVAKVEYGKLSSARTIANLTTTDGREVVGIYTKYTDEGLALIDALNKLKEDTNANL